MAGGRAYILDPSGLAQQATLAVLERFETVDVVDDNETLVGAYTVSGATLYLDGITVTGTFAAEFRIYRNAVHIETKRIEITDPSPTIPFYGVPLAAGEVLEVRVVHYHAGNLHDFEATLKGHKVM